MTFLPTNREEMLEQGFEQVDFVGKDRKSVV